MPGKAAVGVAAGTAGVNHRSNAGPYAAQVGRHAVAVDAVIDMGMQVNQAGGNDFALGVNDPGGFPGGNIRGDAGNFAGRHRYVVNGVKILGRVNDGTAFDEQVVHSRASGRGMVSEWVWIAG